MQTDGTTPIVGPTMLGVIASVCKQVKVRPVSRFQTLRNNYQQHATTCSRVYKRTQHVTPNNVESVCTGLNCKMGYSMTNSPRSIYENSNMTPGLSSNFSIFGLVFLVLKSLLGTVRQWSRENFAILSLTPRSHVRILIHQTWAINNCSKCL